MRALEHWESSTNVRKVVRNGTGQRQPRNLGKYGPVKIDVIVERAIEKAERQKWRVTK
jgi:Holliday junction resolvase RusA-like endonuclease